MSWSRIFVLDGNCSILSSNLAEPLFLDRNSEYVLGLTSFQSFNSIPNIDQTNNKFYCGNKIITIPEGAYEINDLNEIIQSKVFEELNDAVINITANNNTLKTLIKCTKDIDFTKTDSIGPLLGFKKRVLEANRDHESDSVANILKINALCIECNISTGSYKNGIPNHIIHQFFPSVPPGFKIIEAPDHVIYLPINVNTITNITVKILDQDGNIVNFRQETVTVGLHLKKLV